MLSRDISLCHPMDRSIYPVITSTPDRHRQHIFDGNQVLKIFGRELELLSRIRQPCPK